MNSEQERPSPERSRLHHSTRHDAAVTSPAFGQVHCDTGWYMLLSRFEYAVRPLSVHSKSSLILMVGLDHGFFFGCGVIASATAPAAAGGGYSLSHTDTSIGLFPSP